MDDPLVVGLFERLARSGSAIERLSARERGPDSRRSASVGPSTSSMTSARTPPLSSRPKIEAMLRVVELREELRFALEARQALLVLGERRRAGP